MKRAAVGALCTLATLLLGASTASAASDLERLRDQFRSHSGAKLVFDRSELAAGTWYERMPQLSDERKLAAVRIALAEAKKYPRGYLGAIGLTSIGVFDACISSRGDGFRPYNEARQGYLYYGMWNGRDGIAAAYYTDEQLPLTFHHEVFHHVDATVAGATDYAAHFNADDERFAEAISLKKPYPTPKLSAADRKALKRRREGYRLSGAVSAYAAKSPSEDQAETARHLMSSLPDSLTQLVTKPRLAGSQRMLHVLEAYRRAIPNGPDFDFFVDVALDRAQRPPVDRASPNLFVQLEQAAAAGSLGEAKRAEQVRRLLEALANARAEELAAFDGPALYRRSAAITARLLQERIAPRDSDKVFTVHGEEDAIGVNWTLRSDLAQFGLDGLRLRRIARATRASDEVLGRQLLKAIRLVARYHEFIRSNWCVTPGTRRAFQSSIDGLASALPPSQTPLAVKLRMLRLEQLTSAIDAQGRVLLKPAANPHSHKVDDAISDKTVRAAIHRVQPATVRVLPGGSGVNLTPDGMVLTAAHVPDRVGRRQAVMFPDGRTITAKCVYIDAKLDLAILKIEGGSGLPWAPLAPAAPKVGSDVVVIGQPGKRTPSGERTGYEPFHVSVGRIRGFLKNPLGDQSLGRTKHDAWTYWGHSGSPLFDFRGRIVAMHNSWDSSTAMRHAVPWEAIEHFLKRHKVPFRR